MRNSGHADLPLHTEIVPKWLADRMKVLSTLVSKVIYGTPSRFNDPARFSFAHDGKNGHPFPVPLKIYDKSIRVLRDSIKKSKLRYKDKSDCIKHLHETALKIESNRSPQADFNAAIAFKRQHSHEWDRKTV